MIIKKILVSGLVLLGGGITMQGVVAKPGMIEARQPDGTTMIIRMDGGPRGHQIYSHDDQRLMTNEHGYYVVADETFMTRSEKKLMERSNAVLSDTPSTISVPGLMKNPFPAQGDQKALVILVEFPDCKFTIDNPKQHYEEMLNGDNYNQYEATGSARKYFLDNSNNMFNIKFDIYGPIELTKSFTYYGANDYWGDDDKPHEMILEACGILDDQIDFTQYDKNGDGEIDMVYVFYAGYGEADGGGPNTIWPHSAGVASDFVVYKYFDNKLLNHYACSMELQYSSPGHSRPDGIGTFCHEFCHVLGIPDLYSTIGGGAFTPCEWTLMDSGSYNNDSRTPPCLSSFERAAIGWLEPEKLNAPGSYTLKPLGDGNNEAYMISTSSQNEYFLLENRQQTGWDTYLPHHGMLVWHIDYNSTVWNNNTVNINARHQRVDLVEADDIPSNWTIDGDAFPGLYEKTEYTQYTNPALVSWSNQPLGVGIREIKETDNNIYFNVSDLQGISLNVSTLLLHSPESATLTVNFSPNNSKEWQLVWKSNNPEVAEVSDDGIVTAHKSGNAKITVYVEDYPDMKAVCTVNVVPYILKYMVDDTVYSTQYYDQGETITKPKDPEKEGSSFIGWQGLPSEMPAEDVTVSAVFELNEYSITYIVEGKEYKTEKYKYGDLITPPEEPQIEGYTFTGWSGIPETMPAGNITVDATFSINSYNLTYYVDEEEYNKQTIKYGATITPLKDPTKTGYTFSGWSEIPETMPAKDVDVNGSFSLNSYNVYFMVDGVLYHTIKVVYGEKITLPSNPKKEGYNFTGWTGLPTSMPDNDVTVEAAFDKNIYIIKYYIDNNLYSEESWAFEDKVIPLATPEKYGYTFSGWTGLPEYMPAHDLNVYGSFSVNSHTVTFIVDGEEYHKVTVEYGSTIQLPQSPLKEGYTFTGWSLLPGSMPDEDVVVTALFVVNQYDITYYIDNVLYNTQKWNYGSEIIPLPAPERHGYTFSGWKEIPEIMPAKNITVNGFFSINSHRVTFIVDGEEYHNVMVDYGSTIHLPEPPVKEGHTFTGWSVIPETMPNEDLIITASFDINEYEIIYYVDDVEFKRQIWKYGDEIIASDYPVKTGYTFKGWGPIPDTMPSQDIIVKGYFQINSYNIYYYVDDELYEIRTLEYGENIIPPTIVTSDEREFGGWSSTIPTYMPAEDISIYGYTVPKEAGLNEILLNIDDEIFDIYLLNGIILKKEANRDDLLRLTKGIYIIKSINSQYKIII